ncbi:MAG TPA: bacillithiol biosynthesis BshC [Terriglobales bacterium]|nr:bacillithiol biosynthesis BshC [Terriglobales bacterium]
MRTECLPFTLIPHTTPLFTDLLYNYPKVQQFFPRSPDLAQWAKEEAGLIRYDSVRRQKVAAILERQNRAWGASAKTLKNVERLRTGACCMVTGQQVGLFGGPLYAIFKALGAIRLAEKATELGADCVPVFWLATEDHDLAEINHTRLLAGDGSLQPVATSTRGAPDAPVSEIRLGEEIREALENAETALGDSEIAGLLRRCYQPGETLGSAFARLFSALAGRWGVLMLDASDPELHALAQPIYRAAIERAEELDQALLERDRELLSSGYHDQVKVTELSTLLFTIQNGSRVVIQRSNGVARAADFRIGDEKISREKLLERIDGDGSAGSPQEKVRRQELSGATFDRSCDFAFRVRMPRVFGHDTGHSSSPLLSEAAVRHISSQPSQHCSNSSRRCRFATVGRNPKH